MAATGAPVLAEAVMDGLFGRGGWGAMVARLAGVGAVGADLAAPEVGRMTVTAPMACSWRTKAWAWLGSSF